MIQLDLNPQEQQILKEALESYISDLRMEIADTDKQDYREKLKHRREILDKVVGAL